MLEGASQETTPGVKDGAQEHKHGSGASPPG